MKYTDIKLSLQLETLSFEWLDMLMRQVQWALDELDALVLETLTRQECTRHDQLICQLLTFKDQLMLERIHRLATVLGEQVEPLKPCAYQPEQPAPSESNASSYA